MGHHRGSPREEESRHALRHHPASSSSARGGGAASMEAEARWNRVEVPVPGALSSVRVPFDRTTDVTVKGVMTQSDALRRLLRSDALQTEVRVLYELLHSLHHSFRAMKTFKALKQVEQCIDRLRSMKLDAALQGLTDLCPNRIQRGLSLKAGECDVPSQPMLEWLCLRVVGAAQLMQRAMERSSRAFSLSRKHMKWEEFIILNLLLTSLLSRLWVIFRGILAGLLALYAPLLELLREVAAARPMPFLKGGVLPADMEHLLGAAFRSRGPRAPLRSEGKTVQKKQKLSVWAEQRGASRKKKEDLGVAVERGMLFFGAKLFIRVTPATRGTTFCNRETGLELSRDAVEEKSLLMKLTDDALVDADLKPFLAILRKGATQPQQRDSVGKAEKKQMFKAQVKRAATFAAMATSLDSIILDCRSHNMKKEKLFLSFLRLKCQRMKHLEDEGYNLQRRLRSFKQEACWAFSPQGPVPKPRPLSTLTRRALLQRCFHSLRLRWKMAAIRVGLLKRRTKRTDVLVMGQLEEKHASADEAISETSDCKSHDDIDEIFSSVGL